MTNSQARIVARLGERCWKTMSKWVVKSDSDQPSLATEGTSKKLDLTDHLVSCPCTPESDEPMNDLANGSVTLMAVGDSRMVNSLTCQSQEVVVETEDHPMTRVSELNVRCIGRFKQPCLCNR